MNLPPQLAVETIGRPTMMNVTTIATLISTITSLTFADSLMPITSSAVTRATMNIAGMLMMAVTWVKVSYAILLVAKSLMTSSLSTVQPCRMCSWSAIALGTSISLVPGDAVNCAGMLMPKSRRTLVTYPDQPIATVVAPTMYSRIRSQPISQAMNSPIVA